MRPGVAVWLAAACLGAGCSTGGERPDPAPPPPSPRRVLTTEVVESGPVLHPEATAVVTAAGAPHRWFRGRDAVLLSYLVRQREAHGTVGRSAVLLVSREGTPLRRWASTRPKWGRMDWVPAGDGFVALGTYGTPLLLVRPQGVTALVEERASRHARPGDLRFGEGWLLDRGRATVTRERLPRGRCRGGAQVDLHGRTWCLDEEKAVVSWTDDHETWTSHTLSTSHFEWCDGGTTGARLELLGDQVVVGLYRADISPDRGQTWYDVDLPYEMVGAHRARGGSFPNCTGIDQLGDGRLVLSYFDTAVATDPSNTAFTLARFGTPYRSLELLEGVLVGFLRGAGEREVSYDGGTTWVPIRVPELLDALFDDPG